MHKWLVVILLAALGLLQYQLWLGNGGWQDLQEVEQRSDLLAAREGAHAAGAGGG